VDFDRSLADQRTMAELVACYVLATWLLDTFNVVGYLWPSGERGSGKTVLLHTVAEMAYLASPPSAPAMRSSAFSIFSIELAKHSRRYPSP